MIDDEVREALKSLVDDIGATSARIVENDDLRTGVPARTLALGGGEYLRVEMPTRTGRDHDTDAAFERVVRQLRAIRRRWEVSRLPEVTVATGSALPPGTRVIDRIETYMRGLGTIDRATNAFVMRGTHLIAAARVPDELEETRWPLLAQRALATHAPGSS